ncbi:hypothetical protein NE237_021156 [Protea cynaroides]|uniref:Uncharacterized protein n=1 Tax=Protea cynaroides TaxID=273540 RepID=A0A9Q0K308_9MAGN|nr:hypothetical protein NE237_021156 [Protea cynaroides]
MEKKRVFSVIPVLVLVLVLVLVVLLRCEGADHGSSYYSSPACNNTIADCIAEDDEFLMESHVTRRILIGVPISEVYISVYPDITPLGGRAATTSTTLEPSGCLWASSLCLSHSQSQFTSSAILSESSTYNSIS